MLKTTTPCLLQKFEFLNLKRPTLNFKKIKFEKFVSYQETSDTKLSEMALNDLSDDKAPASSNLFFISL